MKRLYDLNVGESALVYKITSRSDMRQRFLDIGLIENTPVECVGQSPAGDPKAYLIRGAVIAIRNDDANDIFIKEE
ncbi:MAG: ferrous iron transport protein A [Clostridia bacterium]|nr:ferrous iron transport protein A [Clostridia bacterium]